MLREAHGLSQEAFAERAGLKYKHYQAIEAGRKNDIRFSTLAKLANGLADDALTCVALALNPKARLLLAPAMNGKMWLHPAPQKHVATLKARGAEFIGPEEGMLSCGYEGLGRLWPVAEVAARAAELLR